MLSEIVTELEARAETADANACTVLEARDADYYAGQAAAFRQAAELLGEHGRDLRGTAAGRQRRRLLTRGRRLFSELSLAERVSDYGNRGAAD